MDISITQRDYYNHHIKLCFFENDENYEDEEDTEENNSKESNHLKEITQSRNILFKKRMLNKANDRGNNIQKEGLNNQRKGINV